MKDVTTVRVPHLLSWVARFVSVLALLPTASARPSTAPEAARLTLHADRPGAKISPLLYGLMTEEINYSYDGGLYAELIQNRIFRDPPDTRYRRFRRGGAPDSMAEREPAPIPHWSLVTTGGARATLATDTGNPVNTTALTTSLRLTIEKVAPGERAGVANDGYWGIPVRPNTTYRASFYARASEEFAGPLTVSIEPNDGSAARASARISRLSTAWRKYSVTLRTGSIAPSKENRFVISAAHTGKVWLNLVSLFPPTYKNRPNGNRIDLMQKLVDMRPAFLRFPGGNYLEGGSWEDRFNWKATIGPLEERPGHMSPWGYRSSDGLGLLEFLEWCEDLKMEPVLAVFAGHILGGRNTTVTGAALEPYVREALEEIEYVTGDASTRWGAQRAKNGHPKPFRLRYVEIGNEDNLSNGLSTYEERFTRFSDAIKARYPGLQIISTVPTTQRGYNRTSRPDVIDDHFYMSAPQALGQARMYDDYPRSPQIFVGEWATRVGDPTPTFGAAVADAAFLTGLERNADLIVMSCYAPLFVNVNPAYPQYPGGPPYGSGMQWSTDLIGYDALASYGSPSYYVQRMFSQNRGDVSLPVEVSAPVSEPPSHGGIGLGTWRTRAEFKDVRVTHDGRELFASDFRQGADGWRPVSGSWHVEDGVYRQTEEEEDVRAVAGDPSWTDYTVSVKARKLGGAEGFLIMFRVRDDGDWYWWNVGGWNNTQHAIEKSVGGSKSLVGRGRPGQVETGRWYDLRVEVEGSRIRCYMDGTLIHDVREEALPTLFASASREGSNGDLIVKVVNAGSTDRRVTIDLRGVRSVAPKASGEMLQGSPTDVNSLSGPERIAPRPLLLRDVAPTFAHTFSANTVSVFRVKSKF
jgi:alpha-L-arabinofuranosidase